MEGREGVYFTTVQDLRLTVMRGGEVEGREEKGGWDGGREKEEGTGKRERERERK